MINRITKEDRKINILFVSTNNNYFIDNNANFNRMYNTLDFFNEHKDFNVIVIQSDKEKGKEDLSLKKNIKCYYFKDFNFLRNRLTIFIDFNLSFITNIRRIIKIHKIDLIHFEYPFGINILRFITKIPISYNAYNVEYIFADQTGKYYYKIPKVFRYFYKKYLFFLEKFSTKFSVNINIVSKYDEQKFIQLYSLPKEKFFMNSFGYIRKIFNNPIDQYRARERLGIEKDKFIIIFHGSFLLNSNLEALYIIKDKIAPKLKNQNILFLIAGRNLPCLRDENNIRFLGYLENLNDFLYSADIAIAPILRGSGLKTKVLDYLSANIPIILTYHASEGISIKDGVHCLITDELDNEIIEKILDLKNNTDKVFEFKKNIRKLMVKNFRWNHILLNLARRYKDIILS